MEHDNDISNPSSNRSFQDLLTARASRRNVVKGSLATAAATFLASSSAGAHRWRPRSLVNFTPVTVANGGGAWPTISDDYQFEVLIPWGEPLLPGAPAFQYPPKAADQAKQIGIGHDGMAFFPARAGRGRFSYQSSHRGLLCINHEYGTNPHVLGKPMPESLADVRVSQHAHGVSVVELAQVRGKWQQVPGPKARRIHGNTRVRFNGPAAASPLLRNPARNLPRGTLNNCANGATPWGTYLTCEENFNGYFEAMSEWTPSEEQARYGLAASGSGYGWANFDPRFDLSNPEFVNEANRFGWVVEIDPEAPRTAPVKRTALGRFKHEGATVTVGKGGRVVVYMGDDERFDYIYKFVSRGNHKAMRARGISPLDEGKLYVARFYEDGSGEWLELTIDDPTLAARFSDQAELLVYTRLAADLLGATPMDRPEWVSVAPNGDVYCTLTNNSARQSPDAPNPMAPNPHGHIIRWRDSDDHVGTAFSWDIYVMAQDTHGTEAAFGSPDGLWIDPDGRLFIQTDGGQPHGLNNQMLVADPHTGALKRLLTGVTGDEVTGITMTPDRRTAFVNLQHPGNGDPSVTNFPAPQDGVTVPRDCTLVITRKDGGIIGS